jgi:putative transferase (TIGR04331 family)
MVEPAMVTAPTPVPRRRQAVEGIGGLGRWQGILSAYVNLLPCRRSRSREWPKPAAVEFPGAFVDLVNELASSTCPESFRDGYAALERHAAAHRYRRGRIYATNINIHDDQTGITLAQAAEAGERIVAVQHGGSYGWSASVPLLAEVEYRHDAFVTWGWRAHDDYDGNFAPLPYPLLSRNLGAHRPTDDHMILVGAVMYSFNPRFDLYPDMLRYRPRKREFLSALPQHVRAMVRYRPYYLDDSFDDAAYLRRIFPDLKVHEGDLVATLMRIKLAVLDHHTTTLAITMAANVPTVCFWDESAWPVGRTARPHFDRLKRAGIVFDTPKDAARHIAAIWPHVQEWWAGTAVQSARRDWCREFARSSRIWPLHWMKGLAALACVR